MSRIYYGNEQFVKVAREIRFGDLVYSRYSYNCIIEAGKPYLVNFKGKDGELGYTNLKGAEMPLFVFLSLGRTRDDFEVYAPVKEVEKERRKLIKKNTKKIEKHRKKIALLEAKIFNLKNEDF